MHNPFPTVDLQTFEPDWTILSILDTEFIIRHRVLPIKKEGHRLHLGMTDPTNDNLLTMIRFHTELQLIPVLITEAELENIIQRFLQTKPLQAQLQAALTKIIPIKETISLSMHSTQDEPVSDLVRHLLNEAIQEHVSDIHFDPGETHYRIRFRKHGWLTEIVTIPLHVATRMILRLKIMANLDIAEQRLPQDGRFTVTHPQTSSVDVRLNLCPMQFGEKAALRLLQTHETPLSLSQLGLTNTQQSLFQSALHRPQGLILVTGPTGSGKTTTLYAALQQFNANEKHILSVEDPIERILPGINQVNIHPKIGFDFATVLRAFLRQDPDIIFLGEIRDPETATIALQAAQTGHLVLSTLHTNSAIDTLIRLQCMGIATHHLIHSLHFILSQRLLRTACPHCQATGCPHCHQGYQSRTALFECLPITPTLTHHLLKNSPRATLLKIAQSEGFKSLRDLAQQKATAGITTQTEINRALMPESTPVHPD